MLRSAIRNQKKDEKSCLSEKYHPMIAFLYATYTYTEPIGGKRMASRSLTKRSYIIIGVLVLLIGGLYAAYKLGFDPYRGTIITAAASKDLSATLGKEEASADLAYLVDKLEKRHPACIAGLPKEVQAQYEKELTLAFSLEKVKVIPEVQCQAPIYHLL